MNSRIIFFMLYLFSSQQLWFCLFMAVLSCQTDVGTHSLLFEVREDKTEQRTVTTRWIRAARVSICVRLRWIAHCHFHMSWFSVWMWTELRAACSFCVSCPDLKKTQTLMIYILLYWEQQCCASGWPQIDEMIQVVAPGRLIDPSVSAPVPPSDWSIFVSRLDQPLFTLTF